MFSVAFFSNHFARSDGTGIARYAQSLVKAIVALDAPYTVLPVATWSNRDEGELAALQDATGLKLLATGRWLTPSLWLSIGLPRLEQLLDIPIDIVHAAYLGYPAATAKPSAVTVHDLGSLVAPQYFANGSTWLLKRHLKQTIRDETAYICVSRATADSLLQYVQDNYAVDVSERTYVVHEGVSDSFLNAPNCAQLPAVNGFDFATPFILAVGKISPRKNLEGVIRALNNLKDTIPHHLLTAGGDGWDYQRVKNLVSALGLSDRVHFLGYVSDEVLKALYSKATLFIFPSLFEGFGLPVLEAMACGCPVITSNVSSLPEVAGDAALLVDPHDIDQLTAAIETICLGPSLSQELVRKGKERARLFSWLKAAKGTLLVYEGLVA